MKVRFPDESESYLDSSSVSGGSNHFLNILEKI